jgi:endonuclease/exonuclease/phosphatase family metal-dependent hydrolase
MKKIFFILAFFILIPTLYIVGVIVFATISDYQPNAIEKTTVENNPTITNNDSIFSFMIWNIGYGGLGANADFFYDGGTMVHSPKPNVDGYFNNIITTIKNNDSIDFVMLQEVDMNSTRSYHINEVETLKAKLNSHGSSFALNYKVDFVPLPFTNPLGKCTSGLLNLFKLSSSQSMRIGFVDANFDYPKKVFFLDRCMLVNRFNLTNNKQLVLLNTHNSAYDVTGKLKQAEMERMKNWIDVEQAKGNYVVVGGDWNQLPPYFNDTIFNTKNTISDAATQEVNKQQIGENYKWVYDATTPTNRSLQAAYNEDTTFKTLIDYYLISNNLELISIKTLDLNFADSDHQPVIMQVKIN